MGDRLFPLVQIPSRNRDKSGTEFHTNHLVEGVVRGKHDDPALAGPMSMKV